MGNRIRRRIVLVCTGNTCRSPLAEGILKKLLPQSWKDRLQITSAGIAAVEGRSVSTNSLMVAAENGIDLSEKKSNRLTFDFVEDSDLVIVMENSQRIALLATSTGSSDRIVTLRGLAPSGEDSAGDDISDPFGGSIEQYRETFHQIQAALEKGWPEIEKRLRGKSLSTD